jgi:hypothetical protein
LALGLISFIITRSSDRAGWGTTGASAASARPEIMFRVVALELFEGARRGGSGGARAVRDGLPAVYDPPVAEEQDPMESTAQIGRSSEA